MSARNRTTSARIDVGVHPAPPRLRPARARLTGRQTPGEAGSRNEWARYFELFSAAPVACALLDPNGVVEEINDAGRALLGGGRRPVRRRALLTFIAADDRAAFLEHMRQVRRQRSPVATELRIQARDGRSLRVQLTTYPAHQPGDSSCWTVLVDLAERERLEEARADAERERLQAVRDRDVSEATVRAKDRLLAVLGHELRTPLAAAMTASEGMSELDGLPDQAAQYAAVIRRSIALEVKLIDNLLDATRIEQDKLDLDLVVLDLVEPLEHALGSFQTALRDRHLEFTMDIRAANTTVRADSVRLQQVFANLLSNAVKFSDAGGRIVVSVCGDEAGRVAVSIADEGIGLVPDQIEHLFRFFGQEGDRSRGGLGLGLAISKGIVEAHGGRIAVASDGPHRGATFTVELPTVDAPEAHTDAASPPRTHAQRRPTRVLLVEDDPDTGLVTTLLLRQHGCEVSVARSVRDALARLREPWDLVVADLALPDGSGLEIARAIARGPAVGPVAIALSGYGPEGQEASRAAGFRAHMVKPVTAAALLAVVDELELS